MKTPTIGSPFVINMLEGAKRQGYDVRKILRENGIAPNILNEPKSRVTFQQFSNLSLALMQLLDDENYGIAGKPQRQNTFKLICYSAINSETVGRALRLIAEFMNILDNGLTFSVREMPSQVRYEISRRSDADIKNSYAIEHMLMAHHRTLCWMANMRIPILHVDLDYPAPSYSSEYRYIFYDAPVHFDQPQCTLVFSRPSMHLPNVRNLEQLKIFLRQMPLTLLSQTIESDDLSAQIRSWLERQLSKHQRAPDIQIAADQFELHPQAIRRRLHKEGTSYQEIKMETRRDLAINLLYYDRKSVEEIASQLDFSEASAFVRAFKKWTGLTPLAYRKLGSQRQVLNS